MAKTLVVKLAGTVDNDDLRKLGEMRIQIKPKTGTVYPNSQCLELSANQPIQMELTGNGHFTDNTLEQNLGTTLALQAGDNSIYVSDSTSILHIYNKYAITLFRLRYGGTGNEHFHWYPNYADFAGMDALTTIDVHYANSTANSTLADFRNLPNLTDLKIISVIRGDLSDIAGLSGLTTLNIIDQTLITGNISSVAGLRNLASLNVTNCFKLTGDTSSIAHLHPNNGGKLAGFGYANTRITGSWPPATE